MRPSALPINQCRAMDGGTKKVQGIGKLSGSVDPRNSAILKIRFAPDWTSWLPMVWGDYWIIKLQGDYQCSLVGTPDRKYLWVLSRTQEADDSAVNALHRLCGYPWLSGRAGQADWLIRLQVTQYRYFCLRHKKNRCIGSGISKLLNPSFRASTGI